MVGSGICNEKIKSPSESLTKVRSLIIPSASPSWLTRVIPLLTQPRWSGVVWNANPPVSTFKIELVLEYVEDKDSPL